MALSTSNSTSPGRRRRADHVEQSRPRAFRSPVKALEIIRELGLQTGRFSLEAWRPDEVAFERPNRPDRDEAMAAAHASAAAYEEWVRQQIQKAIDDPRPSIEDPVMKKADARVYAMHKASVRGLEWKVLAENVLFDILDYIGHDNPSSRGACAGNAAPRLTACASARHCTVPVACRSRAGRVPLHPGNDRLP
ncbi:hypothetical protein P0D71_11320 [Paraburkholderia sp. RL17-383-BIF-A]